MWGDNGLDGVGTIVALRVEDSSVIEWEWQEALHSATSIEGIVGVEGHRNREWCNHADVGEETKIIGDIYVSAAVDEGIIGRLLRVDVDYVVVKDATDA